MFRYSKGICNFILHNYLVFLEFVIELEKNYKFWKLNSNKIPNVIYNTNVQHFIDITHIYNRYIGFNIQITA